MGEGISQRWEQFKNLSLRNMPWNFRFTRKQHPGATQPKIVAMVRLRNEALILQDSLDHLAKIADLIVVFDDASTDESAQISRNHPAVATVIENRRWNSKNRPWEETSNRAKLLKEAQKFGADWLLYCDADERFDGDVRNLILSQHSDVNAIGMNLFDAYLSEQDKEAYATGQQLLGFREMFGPERRRILLAWRGGIDAKYLKVDTRAPEGVPGPIHYLVDCQHYGKGISEEQWDETCDYYISHFPEYAAKWKARKGKAIHRESDFGRPLYSWAEVAAHAVDI